MPVCTWTFLLKIHRCHKPSWQGLRPPPPKRAMPKWTAIFLWWGFPNHYSTEAGSADRSQSIFFQAGLTFELFAKGHGQIRKMSMAKSESCVSEESKTPDWKLFFNIPWGILRRTLIRFFVGYSKFTTLTGIVLSTFVIGLSVCIPMTFNAEAGLALITNAPRH